MQTYLKKNTLFWGWWIVLVSFIANFMIFGARHAFGVFVLPISEELGWSRGQISSVFTVMMIVHGLGSIPFGRWTDKYSPHLTMSSGRRTHHLRPFFHLRYCQFLYRCWCGGRCPGSRVYF